jgi:hypothetical protein
MDRMRDLMRHYATEALFIFPTFPIVLAIFWLANRFAWSDRTISAAIIAWLIAWLGVVLLFADRIIDGVKGFVSRRTKDR